MSDNGIQQMMQMKDKLRTFCPIVLFHEHSVEKYVDITRDSEYNTQFIKDRRKKVEQMMLENAKYWSSISANAREYESYDGSIVASSNLSNSIYTNPTQDPSIEGPLTPKPKRRRGNLPKATTALLKDWLSAHRKHPYPTEEEKLGLAKQTTLSLQQISNWFINARRRHLPHLMESDFHGAGAQQKGPNGELDIYPYEAGNSTDDSGRHMRRHPCTRIKNGAVKKPCVRGRRKVSL